jgi:choloylglycine hydrolase
VHKKSELPFPVLTNNTYTASVKAENNFLHGKTGKFPGNNSLDRFVKACSMVQRFKSEKTSMPVTDFAFSILDSVSQGDFTKWSIVYDINNKEIHFKTESNKDIKTIRLNGFDFACSSDTKMFNMNQAGRGDITGLFIPADRNLMRSVTEQAVRETNSAKMFLISNRDKELLLQYKGASGCN